MLVLSRKAGEKILIGDSISVTIVRIGPGVVRIGVEAPDDLAILREELKHPAIHDASNGHETKGQHMIEVQFSQESEIALTPIPIPAGNVDDHAEPIK
jgi:carbon storage regulator